MASWVSFPLLGPLARRSAHDEGDQGKKRREVREPVFGVRDATIGGRLQDHMELSDFVIGETFWTHDGAFRCTDIGTRVVVAVKLGPREIARAERVMESSGSRSGSTTTRAG